MTEKNGIQKRISTHTLTWSVTQQETKKLYMNLHFNSHAHVERDRVTCVSCENIFNFNSHAHVERDMDNLTALYTRIISTHTLTWSVTKCTKQTHY